MRCLSRAVVILHHKSLSLCHLPAEGAAVASSPSTDDECAVVTGILTSGPGNEDRRVYYHRPQLNNATPETLKKKQQPQQRHHFSVVLPTT